MAVAVVLVGLAGIAPILVGAALRVNPPDDLRSPEWQWIGGSWGEYLPYQVGAGAKAMLALMARPREPQVVAGNGQLRGFTSQGTDGRLEVQSSSGKLAVELPWVYFPGYWARLVADDGATRTLPVTWSRRGMVQVDLPPGAKGQLVTGYGLSPATRAGLALTGATVVLALATALACKRRSRLQAKAPPPASAK
jgi:hypothetical protein